MEFEEFFKKYKNCCDIVAKKNKNTFYECDDLVQECKIELIKFYYVVIPKKTNFTFETLKESYIITYLNWKTKSLLERTIYFKNSELTTKEVFRMRELYRTGENYKELELLSDKHHKKFEPFKDDIFEHGGIVEEEILNNINLKCAISKLNDMDKKLIYQHYYLGLTLTEIGRKNNVTKQAVSHRLKSVLNKLKKELTNNDRKS